MRDKYCAYTDGFEGGLNELFYNLHNSTRFLCL